MGAKKDFFIKTLVLHNAIAKHYGGHIDIVPEGFNITPAMLYDSFSEQIISKELVDYDYVRYRTLELVREEIISNDVEGSCAEAGVFLGGFSGAINRCFPDRKLYLYDTYEGFDDRDLEEQMREFDLKELPLSENVMSTAEQYSTKEQIDIVLSRLITPQNAVIRKGYFPDSVEEERNEHFAFVSIDMDYYRPLLEGLLFFWPRMSEGGYIFMHDYNSHGELTEGAHRAVGDAQKKLGVRFHVVPISDSGGTLVIMK